MEFSGPRRAFSPIGRAFIAHFASLTPKAISMCAALAIALTILLGILHALIKWKAPHLYLFVTNQPQMADSWYPMRAAIDAWNSEHSQTLYQTVFFERHIKFQYPPSSLLIYSFGGPLTDNTLNAISWVCLWIYCVCCGMIAARLIETTFAKQAHRPASPTLAFAFGFLTCISFYPCLQSFWLGQAQTWLNAAFGLACLCWIRDRKGAAGVLIGLSCAMKPQFALFVLWAAARRDWRFVLGWAAVVVPLELTSLYIFGLQNHLDYLKVLAFISSRGEAFVPNQTINGLLNRALGNGEVTWADGEFAPYSFIVHMGTVFTSLAIIASAFWMTAKSARSSHFDFMYAGLAFTLASPIAWEHHYGIMPPIFIATTVALYASRPSRETSLVFAGVLVSYLLMASDVFPLARVVARTPINILASHMLFAGLFMLAALAVLPRNRHTDGPMTAGQTL